MIVSIVPPKGDIRCGRLLAAALCVAVCLVLAGCGGGDRTPPLAELPLVPATHVSLDVRVCNKGANVFCAREVVLTGMGHGSSNALLMRERALLHRLGWKRMDAQAGTEYGVDSPGDKLRLDYATAWAELESVDYGWVKRAHPVALALSHALLTREPTLSMLLIYGAG